MSRLALLGLFTLIGCTDLGEYEGRFRGGIVGTDDLGCDEAPCSFIRRGFEAGTTLTLSFDPDAASRDEGRPGTLTTSDGRFDGTPLLRIAPLEHDQLSQFDFPGARVRNFLFTARTTELEDRPARDAMVFVSLMKNDSIEVRVIAGAGDESRGDLFGLFTLDREN